MENSWSATSASWSVDTAGSRERTATDRVYAADHNCIETGKNLARIYVRRSGKKLDEPGGGRLPWGELKKIAFGLLGLKPWEFWKLTPGEYLEMCEGYNLRVENEMRRLAWHAANIMNVHLKKRHRVTVDQLLGKKRAMTDAEREAELGKLRKAINEWKRGRD